MENKEFFSKCLKAESNKKITLSNKVTETSAYFQDDEVERQVNEAIKKYADSRREGYAIKVYADYHDELSPEHFQQILEAKDPSEMLYELVDEAYMYYDDSYDFDAIFDDLDLSEEIKEEYTGEIYDQLREDFYFEYPYSHYMTEFPADVYLKMEPEGDLAKFDDEDKLEDVNNIVTWLLERQGHSKEEFIKYYNSLPDYERGSGKDNYDTTTFFGSLVQELDSATYNYGELVFLGMVDLQEFIQNNPTQIVIPKGVMCGFENSYNGSGSMLGINLEKDMTLPLEDVTIYHKDGYKYSVDDVHGLIGSCWTDSEFELK